MPIPVIKSFAEKANKTVEEVEKLYKEAKAQVESEYKIKEDNEKYYPLLIGILKKMLGIKDAIEICEHCNEILDSKDKFCSNCGSMFDVSETVLKAINHPDKLGEGAKKRRLLKTKEEVWSAVMNEYKRGTLYSGNGKKVISKDQAKAIAISETERFK